MAAAKSRRIIAAKSRRVIPALVESEIEPIYVRLPKPGTRCPRTGLSRSWLCDVCVPSEKNNWKPPVKSYRVPRKGDKRAIRLIVWESLLSYLRKFEEEAA